jgi:hypothetical protein
VFDKQRRDHKFSYLLIHRDSEPDSFRPIRERGRVLHLRQVPSFYDNVIYWETLSVLASMRAFPVVG